MNHVKRITRWIDAHTLWAYNSSPRYGARRR